MKSILLKGGKVYFLTLVACIMSFFIVVSFNMIKVGLFTETIGYNVYGILQDDSESQTSATDGSIKAAESEFLYKYYLDKGEDTKAEEYEKQGYTLEKKPILSDVSKGPDIVFTILSQISCFVMLLSFIYNEVWKVGNKDFEATRLHGASYNKFKGLLIGLVASIPSFLLLTFCIVAKSTLTAKLSTLIFAYTHAYAFEIIMLVIDNVKVWADLQIWQGFVFYALLLIVPLTCWVAYIIGYKDIIISEKLIYKNSTIKKRG